MSLVCFTHGRVRWATVSRQPRRLRIQALWVRRLRVGVFAFASQPYHDKPSMCCTRSYRPSAQLWPRSSIGKRCRGNRLDTQLIVLKSRAQPLLQIWTSLRGRPLGARPRHRSLPGGHAAQGSQRGHDQHRVREPPRSIPSPLLLHGKVGVPVPTLCCEPKLINLL